MSIKIRKASKNDIPGVLELLKQVNMVHHLGRPDIFNVGTKYSDKELETIFNTESTPVFVAVNESGHVLGHAFCIIKQELHDSILTDIKTLYIDDICVDENTRGEHIGTKLYNHVKDYAISIDCYNVTLNVWSCNLTAMSFYESLGMKPQKIGMEAIL